MRSEEARADLHRFSAKCERRHQAASICHTASRDDRDRNRIAHGRRERHRGKFADVTACFTAFCDDRISSAAFHALRERRRSHDRHHFRTGFLPPIDVVARIACACRDNRNAQFGEEFRKLRRLRVHEHDVHAEGLIGERARKFDLLTHPGKRRRTTGDDAKPARVTHGCC
ncbi:unknown [Eggerthella sp. CAG:298]|nr:unknown [Eggerthella sp. CAG:298]